MKRNKPTHTGKSFVQIEPLEFIERISRFIPCPRRHLRHYHGVFAPNSPLRKKVAAALKNGQNPASRKIYKSLRRRL